MRILALTLLLFLMSFKIEAQIEADKAWHFLGGNLFGLAGAGIAKQASGGSRLWTFVGAVGGATIIGIAKETVDASQRPNGFDADDLAATILGGVTVGLTIDLFTKKKRNRAKMRDKNTTAFYLYEKQQLDWVTTGTHELPSLQLIGISTYRVRIN